MATVTSSPAPVSALAPDRGLVEPSNGDQRVEFVGIGWDGYESLLKVQGERPRPQMIYIDGDVVLMSPSVIHERRSDRLRAFVIEVAVGLDIACESTGETTFRLGKEDAGVQPDQSFYFANHRPIASKDGKEDLDLRVDPPPDLVIEVVHTHDATEAVEVLRRLRVPEVWVCDAARLKILVRKGNGRYVESETSLCFPFLTASVIFEWVTRPGMTSMTQWIKEVRRWVQEDLAPRVRGKS